MFTPFCRTPDGFEISLGTNHFGHFELTRLLIPQLAAADEARVVVLSSGGYVIGVVDLDDPNWEHRDYDKFVAYGASKTANILHAIEADHQLRGLGIEPAPSIPAPWPRRWHGTCPARTSLNCANTQPPVPHRAASRPTATSTSPHPNTVRPPKCGGGQLRTGRPGSGVPGRLPR